MSILIKGNKLMQTNIRLTASEKKRLIKAAKNKGYTNLAGYIREVVMRDVKDAEDNDYRTIGK